MVLAGPGLRPPGQGRRGAGASTRGSTPPGGSAIAAPAGARRLAA
jgi:hypothetical protein